MEQVEAKSVRQGGFTVNKRAPIGVFDSGIGGLTVVRELVRLLPNEDIIYFGDTARAPYGSRPPAEILTFMDEILQFFAAQSVKMAVVACNTMTALGIEAARQRYPFELVGVDTGATAALAASPRGCVGVIATEAAVASGKHAAAIQHQRPDAVVYAKGCPKLVPLIESGDISSAAIEAALAEYIDPMQAGGIESLILGCTHYPFLEKALHRKLGEAVKLVDPARETALTTKRLLTEQGLVSDAPVGRVRLCFSGDPAKAQVMADVALPHLAVPCRQLNLANGSLD